MLITLLMTSCQITVTLGYPLSCFRCLQMSVLMIFLHAWCHLHNWFKRSNYPKWIQLVRNMNIHLWRGTFLSALVNQPITLQIEVVTHWKGPASTLGTTGVTSYTVSTSSSSVCLKSNMLQTHCHQRHYYMYLQQVDLA